MAEEDGSAETKTDLNAVKEEKKKLDQRSEKMRTVRRIVSILLVAAAAAVLLSTFFFPVIQVSGDSMEPSLHDGDRPPHPLYR
jgi:signal peptidase I